MILRLTGYLNKKKNSGLRMVIGSLFASSIVFVTVFMPNSVLLHPIGKITFSLLIIMITFKHFSWFEMLKTWLLFYFISFALGGLLLGLHFIFQESVKFDYGSIFTISTGYGTPIRCGFVVIGLPYFLFFIKQKMDKHNLNNYI